jgi:hypothetical protein
MSFLDSFFPSRRNLIYTAIGLVITSWAYVEDLINRCVLFFYHECGGNTTKTGKSGIPRTQFNRKLKLLSESLSMLPILSIYKDDGLALIARSKTLSEYRDIIIHSVVTRLKPESLILVKYKYNKENIDKPTLQHSQYTIKDLLDLGKKMTGLATDFHHYFQRILNDLGKKELFD